MPISMLLDMAADAHADRIACGTRGKGISYADLCRAALGGASLIAEPYHVAGVGTVLTNIYAGRRMVYLPNFTPDAWLGLVPDERVTNAMVVPTMLARVVECLDGVPADTPTLRAIAYGGVRMPGPVLESALRLFPDTGFVNADVWPDRDQLHDRGADSRGPPGRSRVRRDSRA